MRAVIAVGFFLLIASVGIGMLRSLGGGRPASMAKQLDVVEEADPSVRVLFWCENCYTELLLLRKGSDAPPRHCGETMHRREEVPRA